MEGEDIFDFYHPSDLVTIKEAYENIMADQGKPFKSRPYGFKVKNGGYITLETVWSCFINPWSKQLEFVDGKHTILKGPPNPSVFAEPGETAGSSFEQLLPAAAKAQLDIDPVKLWGLRANKVISFVRYMLELLPKKIQYM